MRILLVSPSPLNSGEWNIPHFDMRKRCVPSLGISILGEIIKQNHEVEMLFYDHKMTSQFITDGPIGKPVNSSRIHVLIPYCLKSPECPCGRFTSECTRECHLCDCEAIFRWAVKNNYHYTVTRGTIFYESYLPEYRDTIGVIITFSCLLDEMKLKIQKVIDEFNLPMVLLTTALTCKTEDIQDAVEGDAKILNHVKNLEQKLHNIEEYLRAL